MVKSKKIISVVAAAAIAITSIASVVGGTLASSQVTWDAVDPKPDTVTHYSLSDGTKAVATSARNWLSSDPDVIAIQSATRTGATLQFKKAGPANIYTINGRGAVSANPRIVVDTDNIAKYTMSNAKAEIESQGDTAQISMNLYGAKVSSTSTPNVYVADTSKTLTMANEITWTSRDTSVATVSNTGLVTAVVGEGSTFIEGAFTDCYGQKQVVNYMVLIGSTGSAVYGPTSGGKYYVSAGGNVFVETDKDGNPVSPAKYIYDKDGDPLTTNDQTPLTQITAAQKATLPSAEEFDATAPGYLTATEKTAYDAAVAAATTAGVKKSGNVVYKPVGAGVWQSVVYNPTSKTYVAVEPASYVGGTTSAPSPSVKLYKIDAVTDNNPYNSGEKASDFDNSYPGYLTGFSTTSPSGEYKSWRDKISSVTVSALSINKTIAGVATGDSVTLTATATPSALSKNTVWSVSSATYGTINTSTGASITFTAERPGDFTITGMCGNKKVTCKVRVALTDYLDTTATGDTTSYWIRLAQKDVNGINYSLIMRAGSILYTTYMLAGGVNNVDYTKTDVQSYINAWYNNTTGSWQKKALYSGGGATSMGTNAALRKQVVQNDSSSKIGTHGSTAVSGVSSPSATVASTGNGVMFALSYNEIANYICKSYYSAEKGTTVTASDAAKKNYTRFASFGSTAQIYVWSRTPSTSTNFVDMIYTDGSLRETADVTLAHVKPACWVKTAGFTDAQWHTTVDTSGM